MAIQANMFTKLYRTRNVIMYLEVPLSFLEWIFRPLIVLLTEIFRKHINSGKLFHMVVHDFQGVKYVLEGMIDSDIKQPLFCQSCDEMFFG